VLTVAEELLSLPYIVSSRMPLSGPIPRQRSAEQQLIGTTSGSQFAGQRTWSALNRAEIFQAAKKDLLSIAAHTGAGPWCTVPGHEFMYSSPCSN
jgi:hypothetical protein